ncbi:hypothetical protein [Cohnella caldifontis]|uniref:hypothetical protein n=1 Tax=Cohnella caldifontis TaxID=3027471 RepID=UPI0023EE055F|nr:hypothetical protein [Cohnella sp. YIM B05605]
MGGFGVGFVIWLILMAVFFFILHAVIRSAVDQSDLTREVRELKERLYNVNLNGDLSARPATGGESADPESEDLTETCPGCGNRVRVSDAYCSDCGFKLRD